MSFLTLLQNRDNNVTILLPSVALSLSEKTPTITATEPVQQVQNIGGVLPSVKKKPIIIKLPLKEIFVDVIQSHQIQVTDHQWVTLGMMGIKLKPLPPTIDLGYDYTSNAFMRDLTTIIASL